MINDDTVLEILRWQQFDRTHNSGEIAQKKYNSILTYIFGIDLNRTNWNVLKDGILIREWYGRCSIKGIKISFYDSFANLTRFRTLEFKGIAKDYKAKVLEKFEILKKQKEEADNKYSNRKIQEQARNIEIAELEKIARLKFEPLKISSSINEAHGQYKLVLVKYFSCKENLIDYVNNFGNKKEAVGG